MGFFLKKIGIFTKLFQIRKSSKFDIECVQKVVIVKNSFFDRKLGFLRKKSKSFQLIEKQFCCRNCFFYLKRILNKVRAEDIPVVAGRFDYFGPMIGIEMVDALSK